MQLLFGIQSLWRYPNLLILLQHSGYMDQVYHSEIDHSPRRIRQHGRPAQWTAPHQPEETFHGRRSLVQGSDHRRSHAQGQSQFNRSCRHRRQRRGSSQPSSAFRHFSQPAHILPFEPVTLFQAITVSRGLRRGRVLGELSGHLRT